MTYSSDEFESKYTYAGRLGCTWSREGTIFRLWAPTAEAVRVHFYVSGDPEAKDEIRWSSMMPNEHGVWVSMEEGDLDGVYYTYEVVLDGKPVMVCDPYAKAAGVNGQRAMVLDSSRTNPPAGRRTGIPTGTPPSPMR